MRLSKTTADEIRVTATYLSCSDLSRDGVISDLNKLKALIAQAEAEIQLPKKNAIKVRIACAVDPEGKWHATGWIDAGEDAWDAVADFPGGGEKRYWIEAELEVPDAEPETIHGTAKEAK